MNGIELAQTVRREYPGVRTIVASGHMKPALPQGHEGIDGFAFIAKPYRLAELVKVMRTAG